MTYDLVLPPTTDSWRTYSLISISILKRRTLASYKCRC